MSPSVTEETIHLPPAPDMFGVVLRRKCELGHWSSSAQEWMGREEEGVGEKEESLSFIRVEETMRLPTCLVNSLIPQAP